MAPTLDAANNDRARAPETPNRHLFIQLLGELGGPEARDTLIHLMSADEDPRVRSLSTIVVCSKFAEMPRNVLIGAIADEELCPLARAWAKYALEGDSAIPEVQTATKQMLARKTSTSAEEALKYQEIAYIKSIHDISTLFFLSVLMTHRDTLVGHVADILFWQLTDECKDQQFAHNSLHHVREPGEQMRWYIELWLVENLKTLRWDAAVGKFRGNQLPE